MGWRMTRERRPRPVSQFPGSSRANAWARLWGAAIVREETAMTSATLPAACAQRRAFACARRDTPVASAADQSPKKPQQQQEKEEEEVVEQSEVVEEEEKQKL